MARGRRTGPGAGEPDPQLQRVERRRRRRARRRRHRGLSRQGARRRRVGQVRGETSTPLLVPRSVPRSASHAARAFVVALGLVAIGAGALSGESLPAVRLVVRLSDDSTSRGARVPVVHSENLLSDGRWLSTLRSGLPVRLHYRLEIWRSRGGGLDHLHRQTEGGVVAGQEPLLDQYTLLTLFANQAHDCRYATVDALSAALAFAYQVNVGP